MGRGGFIRGKEGAIKWSYYAAAALRDYVVTCSPKQTWSLRATLVEADAFKMAQRPLIFVAPYRWTDKKTGKQLVDVWQWPIESVHTEHGIVSAALGPPLP